MKYFFLTFSISIHIIACKPSPNLQNYEAQKSQTPTVKKTTKKVVLSPPRTKTTTFANHSITLDYSSPSVRGRIIFGGTIPFNELWQAGAGNATWIHTPVPLNFEQGVLPAGKYAIFMIPSTTDWIVIFNSHWEQHGKDEYHPKNDVLKLHLKPLITHELTEQLTYNVIKINDTTGRIHFAWESAIVDLDFKLITP
ncbi:DUF2911 domain-containing protein [Flavobacteriaceae bacterium F08102]|nr:DUF2911 domain-containing protein [Flavobacteriaceae bacterium F08102]